MTDPLLSPVVDQHDDVDTNRIVAGIDVYAWRKRHGDLEVFGTWYGTENRPCLLITHAHRRGFRRPPACIVRMDSIWRFDEAATAGETGVIREVAQEMLRMCAFLGLQQNPLNATKLISIIREHIGDALSIPPKPKETQQHVADMIWTDPETGKVQEVEVHDDV